MALQAATHWDGLGHVFYEEHMWNGYDCREVTSAGAQKCGIEKTKNKMVGRGVFLDVARALGKDCLDDGYGITCDDLDMTAKKQGVELKRGDYIVVRTGQMERCFKAGSWDGYPGGDAPGFAFETLEWVQRTELAALASDTWGCEVRPNESKDAGINQPWHWITIPIMGMTMGEIFNVKELAEDCAADGVYEYLFVAPAIPITGAVGSPVTNNVYQPQFKGCGGRDPGNPHNTAQNAYVCKLTPDGTSLVWGSFFGIDHLHRDPVVQALADDAVAEQPSLTQQ